MSDIDGAIIVQALGLTCVPIADASAGDPALGRRPAAAALIILQQRGDGHREIVGRSLYEQPGTDLPLPRLIDEALVPHTPTIVTPRDRATLCIDAMSRRVWATPRLKEVCTGSTAVDPLALPQLGLTGDRLVDEALCRRLRITTPSFDIVEAEPGRGRNGPREVTDTALGSAAARLILWAHGQSFIQGEPDAFFDTLLPLRDWMMDEGKRWPSLATIVRSPAIACATALAFEFRAYRDARDAGEPQARWSSSGKAASHG